MKHINVNISRIGSRKTAIGDSADNVSSEGPVSDLASNPKLNDGVVLMFLLPGIVGSGLLKVDATSSGASETFFNPRAAL